MCCTIGFLTWDVTEVPLSNEGLKDRNDLFSLEGKERSSDVGLRTVDPIPDEDFFEFQEDPRESMTAIRFLAFNTEVLRKRGEDLSSYLGSGIGLPCSK